MGKPPRHRHSANKSHKNASRSPKANAALAASPGAAAQSPKGVISSNSSTGSAPTSVMCDPAPLTRELSDLSGSYMNGNTAPRGSLNRSFGNSVCSEEPVQGFWRQAYLLSNPCPREPAPTPATPTTTSPTTSGSASASALIVVERNGVIELVKKSDNGSSSEDEDTKQKETSPQHDNERSGTINDSSESAEDDLLFLAHNSPASLLLPSQNAADNDESSSRIPILILLMDPGRKQYELMQLWVDPQTDLVRDVLLAVQRKLSDKWRQDYDGLFQLRGNHYCQLVHILSIAKYDLRPRELWVAKPWSMAAKSTIDLANDCIRQLKAGGLLSNYSASSPGKSRIKNFLRTGRNSPVFDEDGPLTLSDEAVKRIYFPDGVLKHHHACQFLSFRAPAIPSRVLGQPLSAHPGGGSSNRGFLGSLLGASQSFDDVSSQLSNPSDAMLLPLSAVETPTKLNSSSSTASPSSSRRQRYSRQQRLPTPVNLDSKWHPHGPLEVVGEVIVNNAKETTVQSNEEEEPANVSTILADLETTNNNRNELNQKIKQQPADAQDPHEPKRQPIPIDTETKRQQRCSIWALFAPLNCARRKSLAGGSRKGDDGYSSSWGGDGSSAKNSKNSSKRSSKHSRNQDDGRESPTSKGSNDGDDATEEPFAWHRAGEESSVVSDSAPLLSRTHPETSSTCSVTNQQALPEQPLQFAHAHQPTQVVSASPFAQYYNGKY